jgi:hypothetical protein
MLLCAGCTGANAQIGSAGSSSPPPTPAPSGSVMEHGAHHSDGPSSAPDDVRLALEQLLGHHAVLMVRLMRGPIDREPEFVAAAEGALARNTDELVAAVGQVYGPDAGARFRSLWTEHITALQDYSQAVAAQSASDKERAMEVLDAYAARYGDLLAGLTRRRLTSAQVAEGVAAHIHHMIGATDAYAARDYSEAYELQRTAYAAMFATGKAMAGAALQKENGELPVDFDAPSEELRSGLGRLLGEHVELAFDATRAIVAGNEAAEAAAAALDRNTGEILTAMRGAVGARAASAFGDIWADHIDALVDFSVAVADGDDVAQSAARAHLDRFPSRLSSFLSPPSGDAAAADTVISALRTHDQQLLQQVTAYAARDYAASHDLAYSGYDHMFAVARTLADVLEGRASTGAPLGGAATGGGGLARR